MSKPFTAEFTWASATVVFIEPDFAAIKKGYTCAIGIKNTAEENEYFISQKLYMEDGNTYVLEKYDHKKLTLFYRREK